MTRGRAFALAALVSCAASLKMNTDPLATLPDPVNITTRMSNASRITIQQWSEITLGPPMLESEACTVAWNSDSNATEYLERDPPVFPQSGIGARRVMYPLYGLDFQIFLPLRFTMEAIYPMPVVVYLHGYGERKWSMMNSQGLPRMLGRNQSTTFDNRSCWCLNASTEAAVELLDNSAVSHGSGTQVTPGHTADCTFADTFPGLVIMPQGWGKEDTPGWTDETFTNVMNLTKEVLNRYNGDAEKVMLTGTGAGGEAALKFASGIGKGLFHFVAATDPPSGTTYSGGLENVTVWVTGDAADGPGATGNDNLVVQLKQRPGGASKMTRYTRYVTTPEAADPGFRSSNKKTTHSADLIYRNPTFWQEVWSAPKTEDGRARWGLEPHPFIKAPW